MCLGVLYLPEGLPLGPLGPWGQAWADPGVTLGHMTNLLCQVCRVHYLAACFALPALAAFCSLRYDTVHVPSAVHVALGGGVGASFITVISGTKAVMACMQCMNFLQSSYAIAGH